MAYDAQIQVGYYDDDDTYHGPFCHATRVEARSVDEALAQASEFLQAKMQALLEPSSEGAVLTLNDEIGELVYDRTLGTVRSILQTNEPPRTLLEVRDHISTELIAFLRRHPDEMYSLRPRQFEELVAEILAHYGWDVQLTPPTRDGGYDIFAVTKDVSGVRNSWIIECKRYGKERKVGVEVVRSLYGAAGGLAKANVAMMLATTATFTEGARRYASSKYNFELRDYRSVLEWINAYTPHPDGRLYLSDSGTIRLSGD